MSLMRGLVAVTSVALKERRSFPLEMAQAVATEGTPASPRHSEPPRQRQQNQKLRDLSSFKLQFNFKTFEDFGLYLILEFNFFELYSVKGFKHWTLMSPREIHNGSEFSLNLGLLCVGILLLVYFYAAIYFHSNSDEPYCATWQFII